MENNSYKERLINRAYSFSLEMMKFIDGLPRRDLSISIISHQIIRSATSIGANIIEAQASSSRKDFTNFLHHALKSANETKYWLGLLRDSGKADKQGAEKLLKEAIELSNLLGSSILSLKGKK
jgi:four helix bundle protein